MIAGNHELSFDDKQSVKEKLDGPAGVAKPRPISASRSAHTGVVIVNPVDEDDDQLDQKPISEHDFPPFLFLDYGCECVGIVKRQEAIWVSLDRSSFHLSEFLDGDTKGRERD